MIDSLADVAPSQYEAHGESCWCIISQMVRMCRFPSLPLPCPPSHWVSAIHMAWYTLRHWCKWWNCWCACCCRCSFCYPLSLLPTLTQLWPHPRMLHPRSTCMRNSASNMEGICATRPSCRYAPHCHGSMQPLYAPLGHPAATPHTTTALCSHPMNQSAILPLRPTLPRLYAATLCTTWPSCRYAPHCHGSMHHSSILPHLAHLWATSHCALRSEAVGTPRRQGLCSQLAHLSATCDSAPGSGAVGTPQEAGVM